MIGWRELLAQARPLDPECTDGAFVERAVRRLLKVKVPLYVNRRFHFPKHVEALESVREEAARLAADEPVEAQMLADLLRHPKRAYVVDGAAIERYALLGAWEVSGITEVRIVVISAEGAGRDARITVDRDWFTTAATPAALARTLERLYLSIPPEFRATREPTQSDADRALWVGGSASEANDPEWRARVEAVLAAHGLAVDFRERPGMNGAETKHAANTFPGRLIICWRPRMGAGRLSAEIAAQRPGHFLALDEYEIEAALDSLRVELAERSPNEVEFLPEAIVYEAGKVYYFKKVDSGGGIDKMIRRSGPCNHNAWARAGEAPQARKGIERLAGLQIRTLQHCAKCTGGGMWRVTFD